MVSRRRLYLPLPCALIALAAAPAPAVAAGAAGKSRPNVVIIVADDQGYADVGVHGCRDIPTPHIDSIAEEGVRFTEGYVSGPYCSPTRAGLLTGRYQQRFGHEYNPAEGAGLPLTETTLADRLNAAGYATGAVGKWHLGFEEKFHPMSRGFDEFFGFLGGEHSYFDWGDGLPVLRGRQRVPREEQTYLTDALGREAAAFVERHKGGPFFLYLAFSAVHTPMEAPQRYLDRFDDIDDPLRRTYAAMTSAMDDAVGRVLDKLRDSGLEEHTIVFYLSDNGGPAANGSDNSPLRGGKTQTLEGGIRVPFFVRWKGRLPAGKTYDRPVIQLDVFPTALAAAGAAGPDDVDRLDGVNLLPHLTGKKTARPHNALYWRFGEQWAVRSGKWKLVRRRGAPEPELYNLDEDVEESRDLAAEKPRKVKDLQDAWDKWDADLAEPKWPPP